MFMLICLKMRACLELVFVNICKTDLLFESCFLNGVESAPRRSSLPGKQHQCPGSCASLPLEEHVSASGVGLTSASQRSTCWGSGLRLLL